MCHSPPREKGSGSKGLDWLQEPGTSKSGFGPSLLLEVLETWADKCSMGYQNQFELGVQCVTGTRLALFNEG